MNTPSEFWYVQLPDTSVRTMTLDELDAAYQASEIDEKTFVLKNGEQSWATLGALLGLDEPAPAVSVTPPPVTTVAPASPFAPTEVAPVYSLRPVVSDVDTDLDFGEPSFRTSSKRTTYFAVVAAAVVVGVGIALASSASGPTPTLAANPPPPAQPVEVAPPPPAPPVAAAPVDRFNDTQKKALLEADKARSAQQKAKMNAAAPRRSGGYKSDGKPVFHKGGDKYDPLNSSL